MLFPGDAGTRERAYLMERQAGELDVDVLKASNHGANSGMNGRVGGKSWMDYVKPSTVVISVAGTGSAGLPHDAAMSAYETVGTDHIHCTSATARLGSSHRRTGGIASNTSSSPTTLAGADRIPTATIPISGMRATPNASTPVRSGAHEELSVAEALHQSPSRMALQGGND